MGGSWIIWILPAKAKRDFGISAVEYVNGFFGGGKMKFTEAGKNAAYLKELLKRSTGRGGRESSAHGG